MHKADAALLDGAKNEIDVLLLIHEPVSSLILGFTQYTHVPVHCAIRLFQQRFRGTIGGARKMVHRARLDKTNPVHFLIVRHSKKFELESEGFSRCAE